MPAHERDPAGVAAHRLDDDDPVVRLGGRVAAVDRVGRDRDGGVEAEGVVGAVQVVVDRLRHADDREARPRRRAGRRRRACPRRRSRPARRSARTCFLTPSTPPSSLYGFVREVPMIVPPLCRIPEISSQPSGFRLPSIMPRQPFRTPNVSWPSSQSRRQTARITGFRPGQSPPPVSIPIRIEWRV